MNPTITTPTIRESLSTSDQLTRDRIATSLAFALPTLWPETFHNPFTDYQRELVDEVECAARNAATNHRRIISSTVRGGGTTSILAASTVWSILVGIHPFAAYISQAKLAGWIRHLVDASPAVQKLYPGLIIARTANAIALETLNIGDCAIVTARYVERLRGLTHHTEGQRIRPSLILVDGDDSTFNRIPKIPPAAVLMVTCDKGSSRRSLRKAG